MKRINKPANPRHAHVVEEVHEADSDAESSSDEEEEDHVEEEGYEELQADDDDAMQNGRAARIHINLKDVCKVRAPATPCFVCTTTAGHALLWCGACYGVGTSFV